MKSSRYGVAGSSANEVCDVEECATIHTMTRRKALKTVAGTFMIPLVEDQVQAGAQPIPALLERHDARVAAADFEGDGGGRNGFMQLVKP
jgi:hypothetical protein